MNTTASSLFLPDKLQAEGSDAIYQPNHHLHSQQKQTLNMINTMNTDQTNNNNSPKIIYVFQNVPNQSSSSAGNLTPTSQPSTQASSQTQLFPQQQQQNHIEDFNTLQKMYNMLSNNPKLCQQILEQMPPQQNLQQQQQQNTFQQTTNYPQQQQSIQSQAIQQQCQQQQGGIQQQQQQQQNLIKSNSEVQYFQNQQNQQYSPNHCNNNSQQQSHFQIEYQQQQQRISALDKRLLSLKQELINEDYRSQQFHKQLSQTTSSISNNKGNLGVNALFNLSSCNNSTIISENGESIMAQNLSNGSSHPVSPSDRNSPFFHQVQQGGSTTMNRTSSSQNTQSFTGLNENNNHSVININQQFSQFGKQNHWIQDFIGFQQIYKLFKANSEQVQWNRLADYKDNLSLIFTPVNLEEMKLIIPKISIRTPPQQQQQSGEVERQKKEGSKPPQSKFHNKNKVLLNTIMKCLVRQNLQCLHMPNKLQKKIMNFIEKVRNTGRQQVNNVIKKSDLFNHSHYNLMFLKLNSKTISILQKRQKDVALHKEVFEIDLKAVDDSFADLDDDTVQKINFINFVKKCVYEILDMHFKQELIRGSGDGDEREYEQRAFIGIRQMSNGHYITRF